jgi:di/tricarboxylate transporter
MLTLIGTPPNIVVSNQLQAEGLPPFGFFSFTPIGLVMLAVGLGFMLLFGPRFLPARAPAAPKRAEDSEAPTIAELAESYGLQGSLFRLRVGPASPLRGRNLAETRLRERYHVSVISIESARDRVSRSLEPGTRFETDDHLFIQGRAEAISRLAEGEGLEVLSLEPGARLLPPNLGLVEVLLTPRSRLLGRTLKELRFRDRYRATVLSIKRLGEALPGDFTDVPLRFADTLLVKGPWRHIDMLQGEHRDFVVVAEPRELSKARLNTGRAPAALIIMLAMLLLLTFEIVPAVVAVLIAAVAMVLAGCLSMDDAYRSINWESVVLIAAILPMATALDKTGGMRLIVDSLITLGGLGPLVMMAALFVLTSAFSQVISNTATMVLVAPIAFGLALELGVSPYAFLMTVAIAASTAFLTPIASPVNTLVLGPGEYRFSDFFKVGILLQLLVLFGTLLTVPLFFPL